MRLKRKKIPKLEHVLATILSAYRNRPKRSDPSRGRRAIQRALEYWGGRRMKRHEEDC